MRNKTFVLTKVLLKNGGGIDFGFKRGSKWSWVLMAAFFLVFIPIALFAFLELIGLLYQGLAVIGQESVIISWGLAISSLIIFIFGIFHILSTFYFANDVENFLPLPVKPREIVGAKFFTVVLYEYLLVGFVFLPILVYYGIQQKAGILFYLYGLIITVFLPIVPLVLAAFLVMLVMRVTNLGRYREMLKIGGGLLSFALGVSINFFLQRFDTITPEMLQQMILDDRNALSMLQTRLFPSVQWALKSLINFEIASGLTNLLIFAALSAAAFLVLLFFAELTYFKGVIGISESGSRRHRIKADQVGGLVKQRTPILSYLLLEMKILIRTPIYFLNCVVINFVWPLFLIMGLFFSSNEAEVGFVERLGTLSGILQEPEIAGIVFGVVLGIAAILGGSNGITATAISREGQQLYVKHYIPMRYQEQLIAKLLSGVVFSYAGFLLMVIPAAVLIKAPVYFTILVLAASFVAMLLTGMMGLMIDLLNPKLDWDTEQMAVKQNMNLLYNMLASMVIGFGLIALTFMLRLEIAAAAVLFSGIVILGCAGMYYLMKTYGTVRFRELEG